jgi:hypothetical protein
VRLSRPVWLPVHCTTLGARAKTSPPRVPVILSFRALTSAAQLHQLRTWRLKPSALQMRLLNTRSYEPGTRKLDITEQWGDDIPPYAIFSHTWSSSEVTFADVLNGSCFDRDAFFKLEKAILQSKQDGWDWLWADNCCIDKTNSVELSEAINSMFKYYKDAEICYAHLVDVCTATWESDICKARWWKRGWTLQELIAPRSLEFFSNNWDRLGTKESIHEIITTVTGIEDEYLMGYPIEHASIAKRMSWAASRETTREEDIAYCLIGIFDVNMPMLYGEGTQRAFFRLQEEIMKSSEDQSLFAWTKTDSNPIQHGLLADSPKDFKNTGSTTAYTANTDCSPSTMTARGLHINLPLTQKDDGTSVAALLCPGLGRRSRLAVYLEKLPTGHNQYARVKCQEMASIATAGQPQEVYIRQRFPSNYSRFDRPHWFQLRTLSCSTVYPDLASYEILEARSMNSEKRYAFSNSAPNPPPQDWSSVPLVYPIKKSPRVLTVALLIRRSYDGEGFVLMLGAHSDFSVGFCVGEIDATASLTSFDKLQDRFAPQPARVHVALELHTVRVSVEERIEESMYAQDKIYFVDIEIQARPKPPTFVQAIDDAIGVVVKRDKQASKASVRGWVKQFRS